MTINGKLKARPNMNPLFAALANARVPIMMADASGVRVRAAYPLPGKRILPVSLPATDFDGGQFDGLDRPIAERLPTGALDTFQYDLDGNLTQSVDGDGHIISDTYNALNEATSETWQTTPAVVTTPSDTIDTVVLENGLKGGSWTLSYNNVPSPAIAYNADAAQVRNALDQIVALSGSVDVSGAGSAADPFVITFVGALANQGTSKVAPLTGDFSGLTVGSSYAPSTASVHTLNVGGEGFSQQQAVGYAATSSYAVTQGSFTLAFNGQTTGDLPYNATATQVQAALEALSTIGAGNVTVTGGGDGSTGAAFYTIDFTGSFGGDLVVRPVTIQSVDLADSGGNPVSTQSSIVTDSTQPNGALPQGDVQQVVVTATSGTFTLGFEGETTTAIDVTATAADVQTALENLPLIGSGNVQVIGAGTWASPFYVSFTGALGAQALPALTDADTPSVANTIATVNNADGQISTIGDDFSKYAYTYDGQGNTASVDNSGTPGVPDVVLSSQYDGMGNRTSLSATIGGVKDFINSYSYDALSRLDGIDQQNQPGGNAVAPKSVYYGLDALGDVTAIDRADTVNAGPQQNGPAYSVLGYSATTGQLIGINHEYMGASLDNLAYTYDGVGRVSTFTSIDGTATYGYDPMSQLTSVTYAMSQGGHQPGDESYSFDTNGNRTAAGNTLPTTDADNHLTSDGMFTFAYDGNGNVVSRTRMSRVQANDHLATYTWDTANRLTDVEMFNNSGTLTARVHYAYDMFGDLIEREVDPVGSGSYTEVAHYVWDAPQSLGEGGIVLAFDGNDNLTNRYLNGPNTSAYDQYYTTQAEEDVTTPAQQGTVSWELLDNQASVRDEVNSSGTLVNHITYNSNGVTAYEQDPSAPRLLGWQGGITDPVTGEENFGLRWYTLADAVWSQPDPIGFLGGTTNLTESRANTAPNVTDPTGEYGRAGHFWTTFVVARAAGFAVNDAYRMAYNSQLPDQDKRLDAHTQWNQAWDPTIDRIWKINIFHFLHSLHGGNEAAVKCRRAVLTTLISESKFPTGWEAGFYIHALGDAFAHTYVDTSGRLRAYGYPDGHGLDSAMPDFLIPEPDSIASDPAKYQQYVRMLFGALSKANNDKAINRALLKKLLDASSDLPSREADAVNTIMVLARSVGYNKEYEPTDKFNTDPLFRAPSRGEMDKWFAKMRKACDDAASRQR